MKNFTPQFSKEDQELAPEIEWLLLSQQYSADQVAEELVKLCFTDLYHWMLLCLDEREAAAVAAIRTILAAAENAYHYPGKIGAVVWVFRLGAPNPPVVAAAVLEKRLDYPVLFSASRFGPDQFPA